MYYSEDLIEEVRSRNDIVDVISGYVRLQRRGSSYFGLCPFHNEKSPSFSVSPGKQMYYCFGCGAGGNVFTFLMEYENYTFPEAVKTLADRCGVELPEVEYSEEARRQADLKSRLLEIQKKAARYYFYELRQPKGRTAYEYLKGRALSDETIKRFGLGYSGQQSREMYQYLKHEGYPDELLKESGLFGMDERSGFYDKFWNRVMFPIMDVNSRVIGFGGRVMGDAKPKYLNSPETRIFDKSRNLYGLNFARSARKPNLIICEGYMDVISMHQAGFNQAVASLGTALTARQRAQRMTHNLLRKSQRSRHCSSLSLSRVTACLIEILQSAIITVHCLFHNLRVRISHPFFRFTNTSNNRSNIAGRHHTIKRTLLRILSMSILRQIAQRAGNMHFSSGRKRLASNNTSKRCFTGAISTD